MEYEKKSLLDELSYLFVNYSEINYESVSRIINRMSLLSSYNEMADVALRLSLVSNYINDEILLGDIVKNITVVAENVTSADAQATMWVALCHAYFSIGFNFKVIEYGLKYINYERPTHENLRSIYNDIAISCYEIEDYSNALKYTDKAYEELIKTSKNNKDPQKIQIVISQTILYHINRALNLVFLNDTKGASEEVIMYNELWDKSLDDFHKERYSPMVQFYNIYVDFIIGNDRDKSIENFVSFMLTKFNPASLNIALTYQQYVDMLNYLMEQNRYEEVIQIANLIKKTRAFRGSPINIYFIELKATYALNKNEDSYGLGNLLIKYESENASNSEYQKKIMRSMIAEQVKINSYEKKYSNIRQQYEIDPLTNAYNRLGLELNASKYMHGRNGSIIFIDLDGLKIINDRFGHEAGDRHLYEFASGALASCGNNGNVYRYGGDEFIIITKYAGNCTESIIESMLRIFATPYSYKGRDYYIRFSYGVVDYVSNSISLSDIIMEADKRMYGLKQKHHNDRITNLDNEHVRYLFNQIKENLGQCAAWNEKVKSVGLQEEWVEKMQERAKIYRMTYNNFESFTDNVIIPIMLGDLKLDEELANIIYEEISSFDKTVFDDYVSLRSLYKMLAQYYEEKDEFIPLIHLYYLLGDSYFSSIQKGIRSDVDDAFDYFAKILDYKDRYNQIEDIADRKIIFDAYNRIIVDAPKLNIISYNRMYRYYQEMNKFLNSKEVTELDGSTLDIVEEVKEIRYSMMKEVLINDEVSSDLKDKIADLVENEFKDVIVNENIEVYDLNPKLYIAYLAAEQFNGKLSYNQIVSHLLTYYDKHSTMQFEFADQWLECYLQSEIPNIILLSWLDKTSLTEDDKTRIQMDLIRRKNYYLNSMKTSRFRNEADKEKSSWAMNTLKFIQGEENQRKYVNQYIIKKQLNDDEHSNLLAVICQYLVKELIIYKPEYFISYNGYKNAEDVCQHENDLLKFIQSCALIHDIGKIGIYNIGDIQYRRISKEEFEIIKKHAKIGYDLISDIEAFEPYKDIILGHHKAYNNEFGYPEIFDSSKSKQKIMIDIVSLADSMDAATDTFNRCYKIPKDFDSMLDELKKGSGNRYSPVLVSLICDHEDVKEKLKEILSVDRAKIYYDIYKELNR